MQFVDAPEMDGIWELSKVNRRIVDNTDVEVGQNRLKKVETHVALGVIFVPPETAVRFPVAFQFLGDARPVFAIVLVFHTGCKVKKKTSCYAC